MDPIERDLTDAPIAHTLGFQPLPAGFFAALAGMVAGYLAFIELGKRFFYRTAPTTPPTQRPTDRYRHLRRRAARFSTAARLPDRTAAR